MCPSLPPELWTMICLFCETRSLHSLTLTNRQLHDIAQPLLYRGCDSSLSINSSRCKSLVLTLAQRSDLAGLCRVLRLGPKHIGAAVASNMIKFLHEEQAIITSTWRRLIAGNMYGHLSDSTIPLDGLLLCLCLNLEELDLLLNLDGQFFHWKIVLRYNPLQHVRILRVIGNFDARVAQWSLLQILPPLPALQTLEIHSCEIIALEDRRSSLRWNHNGITHLCIRFCQVLAHVLERLLGPIDSLEHFEYQWLSYEYAEDLMIAHGTLYLLRRHYSTLRRLKLGLKQTTRGAQMNCPSNYQNFANATELANFTALESLEIDYLAFLNDTSMNWDQVHAPERLTAMLDEILPSSIQSVVLRCCFDEVREHLKQLLRVKESTALDKFPDLSDVHVEMWPRYTEDSWAELKARFHAVGVKLEVKRQPPSVRVKDLHGKVQIEDCQLYDDIPWLFRFREH